MLFNSPLFIFVFLPVSVLVYFLVSRVNLVTPAKIWLVLASLFFYGYWNSSYVLLILASITINYAIGRSLGVHRRLFSAKFYLLIGICFNLGLLGYFKYTNFLIENINLILDSNLVKLDIILPLAISFFTFQQIAYLVDSYKGEAKEYDFLNYCLFVSFFPQLIAGPIVHHKEMMPQFSDRSSTRWNFNNVAAGLLIFCIGLFKKLVIADTFAIWADQGFAATEALQFVDAWKTSLSFTFQLYYDFSAYTDMAMGAALMFNIRLPQNFDSPYKARNIREFWHRWHMTLSRWLRDYVYIPLGGNRQGDITAISSILVTFLLGGLWHGAGWTFVIWGALHGGAMIAFYLWRRIDIQLPGIAAWLLTFLFVNFSWVFFRATDIGNAINVIKGMVDWHSISLAAPGDWIIQDHQHQQSFLQELYQNMTGTPGILLFFGVVFLATLLVRNSVEITFGKSRLGPMHTVFAGTMLLVAYLVSIQTLPAEFLYFNF